MKALIYEGPETLRYTEAPDPEPGQDEHLVRLEAAGICGSDMHAYLGHDARRPAPLILGHEAAGTIEGGPRDGERVTINPLVSCGTCRGCRAGRENLCENRQIISMPPRHGAFADYVAMPGRNLLPVPDTVPLTKASLAEPLACGWHAVRLALAAHGGVTGGARALVLGGGAIGLGSALCLAAQGVADVTMLEPNPNRLAYLRDNCGQHVLSPDELSEEAWFDIVVDGVGVAATRAVASARARPGGVIAHIGLGDGEGGLDIRRMTLSEITFIGSYTYTARDFHDTAQAIFSGRLGPLDWTESRPLAAGAKAFADIRAGDCAAPKIVLRPS